MAVAVAVAVTAAVRLEVRARAFARGEAIIVERCMSHDSRQRVRELLAER